MLAVAVVIVIVYLIGNFISGAVRAHSDHTHIQTVKVVS